MQTNPTTPSPSPTHGRAVLRIVGLVGLVGVIGVALAARWYYGRRAHLTSEWRPLLGDHGTDVSLAGGISAGSMQLERLPEDAILLRLNGTAPGDYFGWSVAGLGDVNDDGVPDVAVGAHQLINAGERPNMNAPAGYVRAFSGADGSVLYTLQSKGSLNIDSSDDMFGVSIAALDDIDADGHADIAVGSFLYDYEDADQSEVDENTGAVFIFSGATGEQVALMGGERWGDRFGFCLDSIPDMDGDGLADLLVGVEKAETDRGVKNAGRVEIYSSATFERLVAANGPGWESRMGHSAIAMGDMDGDGIGDFASGAYMFGAREDQGPQRGAVGIISGRTGEILHGWEGAQMTDNLGKALASLGDLDGDGRNEIALGATQSGLEGEHTGQYFGPGYVRIHSSVDGRLLDVLLGETLGDQFGWTLANIGDRNGDGADDLLVGAPASMTFLDKKLDRRGRIYLFSGADRSLLKAFEGLELNDQFGAAAASIGDLDGDGLDEVLVGAPQNVSQQTEAGYAIIISGSAFAPSGTGDGPR